MQGVNKTNITLESSRKEVHGKILSTMIPRVTDVTSFDPLQSRGNYSATPNNMNLVHWPSMGELLHLVQRGED